MTGVTLNKTSATMEKGGTLSLTAAVTPSDASNKEITWSSSDTTIATVSDEGEITALEPGNVNIFAATEDGVFAFCKVLVVISTWGEPDFELPQMLTEIEEEAFSGLAMTTVKCPEGLTRIGQRAFADCINLRKIYIPETCLRIDKTAFEGCHDLTIFGKADSNAEIYALACNYSFVAIED